MNPNKALWEKGDFTEIAAFMRGSGAALVASLGGTPPVRVLDLGCGDGTTEAAASSWATGSPGDPTFVSQVLKISSAFTPPPPEGFISPMTWGIEANVIERFGQAGVTADKISMAKDTFHFESAEKGPEEFISLFRHFYGPTMNAFDAAQKNGKEEELNAQLIALAKAQNTTSDGSLSIPATYLRVTVSV